MRKRRLILFLLVFTTFFGVSTAWGQEQWLGYRSTREARQVIGDMSRHNIKVSTDKPEGLELPEFTAEEVVFGKWSSPMAKGEHLWIALDKSNKDGMYNRLFIDSDGDGSLSDEQPVESYRTEHRYTYFGPVKVVFEGEDGPISYHLNLQFYSREGRKRLYVNSGCWYEGQIEIGDKKKHCVLIDYNANGIFNDRSLSSGSCDRIRVGKKDSRDTKFVGNFIEVEGVLYELEVARDGAYVVLNKAENVKYGKFEVPETITKFAACGENGLFDVDPEKGTGELPVGKYRINNWEIVREDENGDKWSLSARAYSDKSNFDVSDSTIANLDIGEPVISTLQVRKRAGKYSFNQELKGKLGERIDLRRNGNRPRAPKLHIKNAKGKYDRTFSFEYG